MNDKSICTIYFSPVSVNQNESVCKHCHLDKKQRRFMAGGGDSGGAGPWSAENATANLNRLKVCQHLTIDCQNAQLQMNLTKTYLLPLS